MSDASNEAEPAEVVDLRRLGYEEFDELSGERDFGALWPVEHCVMIEETRSWSDVAQRRFIRSPWPTLTVRQAVLALFNYLPSDYNSQLNPPVRDPQVRAFFALLAPEVTNLLEDDEL
jgi:hypothetical protein